MSNFYCFTSLIGGGSGALDSLDGAGLSDADAAVVIIDGLSYFYHLDATSGAGESSPDVISPDANPGTKRWVLTEVRPFAFADLTDTPNSYATGDIGSLLKVKDDLTGLEFTDEFATEEYVNLALGAFKTFFLTDTASIVGALDLVYPYETGVGESTEVSGAMATNDAQLIKGYITEAGEPGTTTIKAGIIEIHLHAKKGAANHKTTVLYGVISVVDADGSTGKTTIATTEISAELTENAAAIQIHAAIGDDVEIVDTARLILDIYANVGSGSTNSVVTLYMEGVYDSYFITPIQSGLWQNHSDVLDDLSGTGATAVELDELTDGSETTLHSHEIAEAFTDLTDTPASFASGDVGKVVKVSAGLELEFVDEDILDTEATAAELDELTDGSETALHSHGVEAFGRPLVFTPQMNEPPAANFATIDTRNNHLVLDFDPTTNESAVFSGVLPTGYAGGGLTVYIHYAMTSAVADTIDWDVAFERIGDQQLDIDGDSFAAVNSVDNTTVPGTTGLVDVVSVAFTDGVDMDSIAAGESFRIKVTRDAASDDAAGDAEVLRVVIKETV